MVSYRPVSADATVTAVQVGLQYVSVAGRYAGSYRPAEERGAIAVRSEK